MNKVYKTMKILSASAFAALFMLTFSMDANAVTNNSEVAAEKNELNENSSMDRPIAIVRRFRPDVYVSASDGEWVEATTAHQLFDSDTLQTGDEGYAVVQFMDNSVAKMKPNSILIITGEVSSGGRTAARLAMELGEVFLEVSGRNSDYEMSTPTAVAAVKGTKFNTNVDGSGSTFTGFSGLVGITGEDGQEHDMGPGEQAFADGSGVNVGPLSDEEIEEMLNSYEEFDESLNNQDNGTNSLRLNFIDEDGERKTIRIRYRSTDN